MVKSGSGDGGPSRFMTVMVVVVAGDGGDKHSVRRSDNDAEQ